jgi:glycosyltransferase involved in cell wall biosynthesis
LGSQIDFDDLNLPICSKFSIDAHGSGAIYSPAKIDIKGLEDALTSINPDLVVTEAWQTALTEACIDIASKLNIPILMISHGISIHPYANSVHNWIRYLAWLPYRYFKLPRLIKKLNAITALDNLSSSNRFFDRELAKKNNIPIISLKNCPSHRSAKVVPRADRQMQILVVGYFSAVKNQLTAIEVLSQLPESISCCFIGDRCGDYFEACQKRVTKLGLTSRVSFLQDDECDLAEKINQSILVFSPSITEALPITLIEAMACGTPFVATPVGAVSSFSGGILADSKQSQIEAINALITETTLWQKYSDAGIQQVEADFTEDRIAAQLANAINTAMQKSK